MKLPPCKTFLHYPHAKHRAEGIITITDRARVCEPWPSLRIAVKSTVTRQVSTTSKQWHDIPFSFSQKEKEREPTDEFSSKHKRKDTRVRVVFRLWIADAGTLSVSSQRWDRLGFRAAGKNYVARALSWSIIFFYWCPLSLVCFYLHFSSMTLPCSSSLAPLWSAVILSSFHRLKYTTAQKTYEFFVRKFFWHPSCNSIKRNSIKLHQLSRTTHISEFRRTPSHHLIDHTRPVYAMKLQSEAWFCSTHPPIIPNKSTHK